MRRFVMVLLTGCLLATATAALGAGLADPLEAVDRQWQGRLHVRKVFGKPERVGHFALETRGLFGAGEDEAPSKVQFFRGIRKLMPPNFKFLAGYLRKSTAEEVYTFRSSALKSIESKEADAKKGTLYGSRPGTFTLVVNRDSDGNRIATCTMHLGLPEDFSGGSILSNPFM
ncbi:hypothetical protein LPW11_17025 [Geomonas sp. RF6]|uniref:hypothetical protein n=1 Tax=Geomonas sp. RF6 TaxID=2897342 RepID=UPI001E3BE9EB|nr:hypothetical protein [Geomonas sp. RF6]UFS69589.1 hypothetical protein LPW11_17025 [Geomonas sp. RF6]